MFAAAGCATVLIGCGHGSRAESVVNSKKDTIAFRIPDIPNDLHTPSERIVYLSEHYWDCFGFQDTLLVHQSVLEQAFVDYLVILNSIPVETAKESIKILIARASQNWDMQNFIIDLFGKYLYEPNSPFRNEDLYIPFLEILTQLPTAKTEDILTGQYRLKIALKNRPGTRATDFAYKDRSGQLQKMSGIRSEYTLVVFYDPDCENCHKAIRLLASLAVSHCSRLKIFAIYPDEEEDKWKEKMGEIPDAWINGYSPDGEVAKKELYDVRALPAFYLLDASKKVVFKDAPLDSILEYINQNLY